MGVRRGSEFAAGRGGNCVEFVAVGADNSVKFVVVCAEVEEDDSGCWS